MTITTPNCPQCGNADAKKVGFTWWGGLIGPRLFHRVQCTRCGTQYNGKTGRKDNGAIVVFVVAAFGIPLACVAAIALVVAVLNFAPLAKSPSPKAQVIPPTSVPTTLGVTPTVVRSATGTTDSTSALALAFDKTKRVTAFRMIEDLSGSVAILPNLGDSTADQQITPIHMEGEYNRDDYHLRIRGQLAAFFGADSAKGMEVTRRAGKTFVSGPAPLLNVPDNKWYALGSDAQMFPSSSPLDALDKITGQAAFWASFDRTRSGDSLDGQQCDLYTAGRDAAASVFAALTSNLMPKERKIAVDQGSVSVYVCNDGYLHNLVADFAARDEAYLEKTGKAKIGLDIYGFDGDVNITPPLAPISLTPVAPSVPTTAKAMPTTAPRLLTGYDGEWRGTTSDDNEISFEVEDNQITSVTLGYSAFADNALITGKNMSVQLTDSSGKQYTFAGTFTSNSQANGTLAVKGLTTTCGNIDTMPTWTATLATATASPTPPAAKPSPTRPKVSVSTPTAAPAQADAKAIITRLFERLNAKDMDGALALVDDDPIVNWGTSPAIMDKADLRTFLTSQANRGITFQVTVNSSVGNAIAYFSVKEIGGSATYSGSSAILSSGKIEILNIR